MILISWQRDSQIASECVPGEEERGRMTAVQQWQPGRLHESQDEDRLLRQPWHQGEQPGYTSARVPSCLRRWCHTSEPCQALFWYQSPPLLCPFLLPLDTDTWWKDRPGVCMYAQDNSAPIQHSSFLVRQEVGKWWSTKVVQIPARWSTVRHLVSDRNQFITPHFTKHREFRKKHRVPFLHGSLVGFGIPELWVNFISFHLCLLQKRT